jgi:acyl-CoA dehydrogenase
MLSAMNSEGQGMPDPKRSWRHWRALADAGFMGLGLPAAYGGSDGDWTVLVDVAEALAHRGGCPGIVTSWLGHQLISRLHILRLGSNDQKERYLPRLASGQLTPCLAISEPGAGAHPKRLSARAERDGDDVVISGEKAYLTNGPIAGLFLVLAIDDVIDGRKQFSVYMVPADAPGLTRTEGVHVDFLKPSPHCGLKLENVRVPAANRLGTRGKAFEEISLPMRRVEDALFAASMAGTMRRRIELLVRAMDKLPSDQDVLAAIGTLITLPEGLLALARQGALLVSADGEEDSATIAGIAAAARHWVGQAEDKIAGLVDNCAIQETKEMAYLRRDVAGILKIAGAAHRIQAAKRAAALF